MSKRNYTGFRSYTQYKIQQEVKGKWGNAHKRFYRTYSDAEELVKRWSGWSPNLKLKILQREVTVVTSEWKEVEL